MALTYCPDCKETVSSRAISCIHCGAPLVPQKQGRLIFTFETGRWFSLYSIRICTKDKTELIRFRGSVTVNIPIFEETDIYAESDMPWDHIPTNSVRIFPDKINRVTLSWTEREERQNSMELICTEVADL